MKKLMLAIGFLFTAALAVNAQDSTQYRRDPVPTDTTTQEDQDQSEQYRTEEPARDTTSLSTEGEQDMSQDTTSTAAQEQSATQTTESTDQSTTTQDQSATQDQSSAYRTDGQNQDQEQYDDKEVIATSELPAMVRDQLQGTDYSGWTVNKAWKKEKDGETIYAVELKSGSEMKKVKFDAQGNKLKEKDKKDKDHK